MEHHKYIDGDGIAYHPAHDSIKKKRKEEIGSDSESTSKIGDLDTVHATKDKEENRSNPTIVGHPCLTLD